MNRLDLGKDGGGSRELLRKSVRDQTGIDFDRRGDSGSVGTRSRKITLVGLSRPFVQRSVNQTLPIHLSAKRFHERARTITADCAESFRRTTRWSVDEVARRLPAVE